MKGIILVTDSLFIFPEHEEKLRQAGYEVERLNKPEATEEELIRAVAGKVGYILGGIEKVTDRVIEAADQLKALVFTGSDVRAFVPGFDTATKKGIAITNTPGTNSYAVGEYSIALMLAMTRNLFELGRTGDKTFETTRSLDELTIGIVGMGNVGKQVVKSLQGLGTKQILYFSRTRNKEVEATGVEYRELKELLQESDVVSLYIPKSAGEGFIGKEELSLMKDGALLISIASRILIDHDALYEELSSGRLRAATDGKMDDRFDRLPYSTWFCSNESAAYNTRSANQKASDIAVDELLRLLSTI